MSPLMNGKAGRVMTVAAPYLMTKAITASDATGITARNAALVAGYAIQQSVLAVPVNVRAAMSLSAGIAQIPAKYAKKRFVRIV
jgi:hypothetical protein